MPIDPSMLFDPEAGPTTADEARARVAALRNQAGLGQIAMLGDDWSQNVGKSLIGDSQQQQVMMGQQADRLMNRTIQAQRAQSADDYHKAVEALRTRGLDVKEDKNNQLQIKRGIDGAFYAADPSTGELTLVQEAPKSLPGRVRPGGSGVGAGAGGPDVKQQKLLGSQEKELDADLRASGARAGALGQDYVRLANAQNLKTILQNNGGVIPPQMVAEATAALGRLVTGGVVTEGTMEKMMPSTAGMDMANRLQYITGNPHDAGVKSFLEYMDHTADREAKNASERMRTERLARLARHNQLYKADKASVYRIGKGYGLQPQDIDSVLGDGPAPSAGSPATAAPSQVSPTSTLPAAKPLTKTLNGVTKMWDGKGWVPVPNV